MKPSREEYEAMIYRIAELSDHIVYSDLVLIPAGRKLATLAGNIHFANGSRLQIRASGHQTPPHSSAQSFFQKSQPSLFD